MPKRRTSRWRTKFGSWISDYGVSNLIRDLGSAGTPHTHQAVYHWIAGYVSPRPHVARQLVRMSRGALSLEAVYRHRDEVATDGDGNGSIHTGTAGSHGVAAERK